MIYVPDGLDPDEAAQFAREEVEAEIAWAEEREREREEAEEVRQRQRDAAIDASYDEWLAKQDTTPRREQ